MYITKVDQVLSGQWTGTNDSDYYYRNLEKTKLFLVVLTIKQVEENKETTMVS